MREPLSVVVITFNNADTLERCLAAADWADEIVVLDSGSTDATVDIAARHGARIATHPFDDYGPQKQRAIDSASHDWILNLDADEVLSPGTREVIEEALIAPDVAGFRLPRRERMFWSVQHPKSWRNGHLRLFDRRRGRMNNVPVHAAVEVGLVDIEHPVHLREVETDAAVQRRDVALERRAHAERDDRDARRVTCPRDRGHFVVGVRKHDDVGQRGVGEALAMRVLLADRLGGDRAVAVVVAQTPRQRLDGVALRTGAVRGRCKRHVRKGMVAGQKRGSS